MVERISPEMPVKGLAHSTLDTWLLSRIPYLRNILTRPPYFSGDGRADLSYL